MATSLLSNLMEGDQLEHAPKTRRDRPPILSSTSLRHLGQFCLATTPSSYLLCFNILQAPYLMEFFNLILAFQSEDVFHHPGFSLASE